MGQLGSRFLAVIHQRSEGGGVGGVGGEEGDPNHLDIYSRCDPGSYFGKHFMMGSQRYKVAEPEASLFFVENKELDLLGDRPVTFPYHTGKEDDNIHPLNVYVNIRKESVKFVRVPNEDGVTGDSYRIEFIFDADRPGYIQLHFNAMEFMDGREIRFAYRDMANPQFSEQYPFIVGADQYFSDYVFVTSKFDMSKLQYKGGNFFPVLIAMATSPSTDSPQLQSTVCTIDQASDNTHSLMLKPKRQKVSVDGVMYLLQELFGLENKESDTANEDNGFECSICLSDVRDTVILPCRHLCLCNGCAETLRLKANNCPICRKPFRALVQLWARRTMNSVTVTDPANGARTRSQSKYERLELVEALNGPRCYPVEGSTSSIVNEEGDDLRRRSTRSRGHKVVGKKAIVDEVKETEDGIELTSAEYFQHRPVNVVVVKPAPIKAPIKSEPSSSVDKDSSSDEELPTVPQTQITSDPSSVDSQDSSNALLDQKTQQ